MAETPMPWEIPGAPKPSDYVGKPANPYTIKTLADELFDYANEIVRVMDSGHVDDVILKQRLADIAGRMKKTANQATI